MWTKSSLGILILLCLQDQKFASNVPQMNDRSVSNGFGMRFRLPFIDMNIQSVSNLKIIKDVAGQDIFVLHGIELYRLTLEREIKRINLIGYLEADWRESDLLDAEIISWRDLFLLVVALEDHLEVYQFSNDTISRRYLSSSEVPSMDAVQQITLHGQYRKLFLCDSSEDSVTLIVLVNFNKFNSRINTYDWSKTYFDPMEEKNIPPVEDIRVIGASGNKFIITNHLSRSQTKTTLTIYSLLPTIKQIHVMQLTSKAVHVFTYQDKNYLLTCAPGHSKCTIFKMAEKQFEVYKKRPASEVTFSHFTAGDHFLVGLKDERVSVYLNTRLECYGTFRTSTDDISAILTHISPRGCHFIVLNYSRTNSTLLRLVEIEFEQKPSTESQDESDELSDPLKHQKHAFEQTIAKLRKILLSQKYSFDEIKSAMHGASQNVAYKNPVKILSGNIGIVKLVGSKLRSPLQIRQSLQAISNGSRRTRFSRGFVEEFNKTSTLNLKVKTLQVGNLILENDLIPGFNLNSDQDYLKISVPVTTKVLETKELLTATVMQSSKERRFFTRSLSESTVNVRNLKVNRINGVLWDEFYENVFLRSRDRTISGRLILQSSVEIDNLETRLLNRVPTASLFDLVSVQNITSDFVVSRFFSNDLEVGLLNGLDFGRDIAIKGRNNIVNSPVVAEEVSVSGELELAENDDGARHVFGTSFLDFEQTYTGKVFIDGSLTLVNLAMEDQEKTRIVVDGQEILADIPQNFWMKSTPQVFDLPITFSDCTISAPLMNTVQLNGFPLSDYLLTTTEATVKPVHLILLSSQIQGNLTADAKLGSKLRHIKKIAINKNSDLSPLIVSGEKVFQGSLAIDHGEIEFLNELPVEDLITIDEKVVKFTGNKTFKEIHVSEKATITKELNVRLLNGDVIGDDLFDPNDYFGKIILSSPLKVKNLEFTYMNGFPSKKILSSIRNVDNDLILHKDLYVVGSIDFKADLRVDTINDIIWKDYVKSLVRVNENTKIYGRKIFTNLTISSELKIPTINNIRVDDVFPYLLLRSQPQVITGTYTFDSLKLQNINVPIINGFPTTAFIDRRSAKITLNSDLIMKKLVLHGNLYGNSEIDFYSIQARLNSLLAQPWKNLYVLGNARWPWGEDQQSLDLQYLFENAVKHFDDQIITGNVKLRKPLISTMSTKESFPKDIDFNYIVSDCLFHNSSMKEIVLAAKIFSKPIQFTEFTTLSYLGSKIINGIDILEFNSSLYQLSQPSVIYGSLDFQVPPIFGHLVVQGLVNSMPIDRLFLAYDDRVWPPVNMRSLEIEGNLQLFDVDQMSLDFLLRNRVRKSGPAQEVFGHLTFENLVLNKKIYMQSINGISLDNVVQKTSNIVQEITGTKIVKGKLELEGPTMVVKLNNKDLIERYSKTVFLDKNYDFDKLSIKNVTFKQKLNAPLLSTNNPLHEYIQNETYKQTFKLHSETLKNIQTKLVAIENVIDTKALNTKRLVYLDYDFSTSVEWKLRNDSIQEQFVFDNNRYQYCDREQTIVKWSRYHNRISMSKTISNTIMADDYGIQVTAENNCKHGLRQASSLITINEVHFEKRFILNKLVHSIDIYNAVDIFIMIHSVDLYGGNNEIRFLKIDSNSKTIRDWQLLTDGVGKVSKLFKLISHTILVVQTIVENYPSITIYNLNTVTQIFDIVQIIDGDFDIIELAQVTPTNFHLFLSCVHCQRIVIFEYDSRISTSIEDCQMYHIYQIIKLKARIDRFNLFTLSDGEIYLLVLSDQDIDFYHIYKYQYIQGWKHYTYGYFKNIQNAYPLLKGGVSSVDDNLLLLCNRKCTLVKAFYQL